MDFEFGVVDSVDVVPEQFRPLYVEGQGDNAGKFVVGDTFKGIVEAITGFNKSNKTLRNELKTVKGKQVDLSPLSVYGDDPKTIAEAVEAAITEAGAGKNSDVKKAVEAAKQAMAEGHAQELQKHAQRNEGLQGQLYKLLVENAATSAIAEAKGIPKLLMPFVQNQVNVVEEDGEFKVQVVDDKKEVRYGMTGSPMTIKELITEMKSQEEYGRLFESETPGGGGMNPGGARRPAPAPGQKLSANEKIAVGLSKGQFTRNAAR